MKNPARLAIALACLGLSQLALAKDAFDIKQFAEAFIAAEKVAWERGELAALEALEHPDVLFQNIDGTTYRGWDAHKKAITDARASFAGARMTQEWRYLMGEGNMFSLSYKWTIHLPQRPMEVTGIVVGRVKDGKLAEEWGMSRSAPAAAKQ